MITPQSATPSLRLDRVTLTVNDLDRVGAWYEKAVGLHRLAGDATAATYGGADGQVLLELRRDAAARRRSPREAGLFHTAFLLPDRADLGRWIRQAIEDQTRIAGASDHEVSEALYLTDPEGNGVEIYADRPADQWAYEGGLVRMGSEQLDIGSLVRASEGPAWTGFPAGSVVGHVHLQVGAIPQAEAFWTKTFGLDLTCKYPGGSFFAADGYHHHIATNIWNSRGAGVRDMPSTGLASVQVQLSAGRLAAIRAAAGVAGAAAQVTLADPWGTPFELNLI